MPTIPTYERRISIPGEGTNQTMNVGQAGIVGDAIQQFGNTLGRASSQVADQLIKAKEQQDEEDRQIRALNLANAYDMDKNKFLDEYKGKAGDEAKYGQDQYNTFSAKAKENLLAGETDKRVIAAFTRHTISADNHALNEVASHEAGQRKETRNLAISNTFQGLFKDAMNGTIPFYDLMTRGTQTVADLNATGSYKGDPQQAEQDMIAFQQNLPKYWIEGIINRNPKEAIRQINEGLLDTYMTAKDIDHYRDAAKTLQKALDHDAVSKEKEAKAAEIEVLNSQIQDIRMSISDDILNGKATETSIAKTIRGVWKDSHPSTIKDRILDLKKTAIADLQHRQSLLEAKARRAEKDGEKQTDDADTLANLTKSINELGKGSSREEILNMKMSIQDAELSDNITKKTATKLKGKLDLMIKLAPDIKAQQGKISSRLKHAQEAGLLGKGTDGKKAFGHINEVMDEWIAAGLPLDKFEEEVFKPYVRRRIIPFTDTAVPGTDATTEISPNDAIKNVEAELKNRAVAPTRGATAPAKTTPPTGKTKDGRDVWRWSDGKLHTTPEVK